MQLIGLCIMCEVLGRGMGQTDYHPITIHDSVMIQTYKQVKFVKFKHRLFLVLTSFPS